MDIRFINSKNEVINVTNLSIKIIKNALIGINEKNDVIEIEKYGDEKAAKEVLEKVVEFIYRGTSNENENIIINLGRERRSDGKFK